MFPIIKITLGDITKIPVDVIVNAANKRLLRGGGVCGAIHSTAGPELLNECKSLGGCESGEAKITMAYNLPAKYVVHTVGPIWDDHEPKEAERLLYNCYQKSLALADIYECESISFPAISTGAYGYPIKEATRVARRAIENYTQDNLTNLEEITLVLFSESDLKVYLELFK